MIAYFIIKPCLLYPTITMLGMKLRPISIGMLCNVHILKICLWDSLWYNNSNNRLECKTGLLAKRIQ